MARGRRRPALVDEGTENFWPSFADLTSTVTLILFFEPQSFAKLSNHLSYSGTK